MWLKLKRNDEYIIIYMYIPRGSFGTMKAEVAFAMPFCRDINIRFRAYFTNDNVNA